MGKPFTSFVLLAAMRTGSNFLEESLNRVAGLTCHGEAFNPVFIGYPDRAELLGTSQAERDRDPMALLDLIRVQPGLNGFRYFPDHDARVLDTILTDPSCAKIVLNRNPLDSYVSLKIARETGQWRLGGPGRRTARVAFDAPEFEGHLDQLQRFQLRVLRALQTSGQTAFYLDYDDIGDAEVLAGLARFLGLSAKVPPPARRTLPQNPEPVAEKVTNPAEMTAALAALDPFQMGRAPNFEPRRGPGVPDFIVAARAPILFMPIPGGPTGRISDWLANVGEGVRDGFAQSTLRDWMRANAPFRSFTVVSHPVVRAWAAFRRLYLDGKDPELAGLIARQWAVATPDPADPAALRAAFRSFLLFLKASLSGQTALRVDSGWASQLTILQGFSQFSPPDLVLRESALDHGLHHLCAELGLVPPAAPGQPQPLPDGLYNDEIERLVRQTYGRDYTAFGMTDFSAIIQGKP